MIDEWSRTFDDNDPGDPADDAVVTMAYDSLGRLLREEQNGVAVAGAFDGVGNRRHLAYPSGLSVETLFDDLNRQKTVTSSSSPGTPMATYGYIGPWRERTRAYGNGVVRDVAFDNMRRVSGVAIRRGQEAIDEFGYKFDAAGNRRVTLDGAFEEGEAYSYDSDSRLAGAGYRLSPMNVDGLTSGEIFNAQTDPLVDAAPEREEFGMDGVGNFRELQRETGTEHRDVSTTNEYTNVNGTPYASDGEGNLTSDGQKEYIWDALNRLREIRNTGGGAVIARYNYDTRNRRLSKIVNPGSPAESKTVFVWDGWNPLEDRDGNGNVLMAHIGGRRMNDYIASVGPGNTIQYYHADTLGNVTALSDAAGTVQVRHRYSAYGQAKTFNTNGTQVSASFIGPSPFGYTGHRMDQETGLVYMRNRYLSPYLARFLSRDSLITEDKIQLYSSNNPLRFIDPLGLNTKDNSNPIPDIHDAEVNTDRTPIHDGPPDGWLEFIDKSGEGHQRHFDKNGDATHDIDWGKPHGGTDPHVHDWDHSNPDNPRGEKRPPNSDDWPKDPYEPVDTDYWTRNTGDGDDDGPGFPVPPGGCVSSSLEVCPVIIIHADLCATSNSPFCSNRGGHISQ